MIERVHHRDMPGGAREYRRAVFSPCERYRYVLEIVFDELALFPKPYCAFIGLNPSTADELEDDNTLRRCKGFAQAWGYGALLMLNVAAFRATDPKAMLVEPDPIGPRNLPHDIASHYARAELVVACWGANVMKQPLRSQARVIREDLQAADRYRVLALTQGMEPKHPLYLRGDSKPIKPKEIHPWLA